MRLALMVEGQEGVTWRQWVDLARACEDAGIETLFRSDHYGTVLGAGQDALDAWSTVAALAARTSRLRLGVLVSPVTFRHPSVLARCVATADHVSDGRVEVGIGAGWNTDEHEAFGFPFPATGTRLAMLAEQLEIITRQWQEGPFDFAGEHYRLRAGDARPKPLQQPHPPLLLGGSAGPRAARLAARYADEYNTTFATLEQCRERRAALDAACEQRGRDPRSLAFSLMTAVVVGGDQGDLQARAERLAQARGAASPEAALRDVADSGGVVGTLDEVAARLRDYEAVGIERVMAQMQDHADLGLVGVLGALAARL